MSTDVSQTRVAGIWRLDPLHSVATFAVQYLVAPFRAQFELLSAELVDGRLTGTVDVTSLNLKDEYFASQVHSPQFFDAERFPEISFASDELHIDGDDVVVDGSLTLKGVTRSIRAIGTIKGPIEDFMGKTRLGLELTTTLDRTVYGLGWNAALPAGGNALADDVTVLVALELIEATQAAT